MTLVLMVFVPLAVAVLLVLAGARIGRGLSAIVGAGGLVVAFATAGAVAQAFAAGKTSLVAELGPWLPIRGADPALRVDALTVPLLLATTAIAALIGVWAAASLRRDAGAVRFFVALDLLVAALLVVLMARDLILLLAGWQLVGVAAYLLLAHERHRPAAAFAAARAFVLGRVAEVFLLFAVFAVLALFQTVDIEQIAGRLVASRLAPAAESGVVVASVLVVLAALVRSAQIPFHPWLPDSSQAPAAPRAAIHALVTMSGALLLLRLSAVLHPSALFGAATVGVISAVLAIVAAATAGRGPSRERWLTVAHLGIVIVAFGVGSSITAWLVVATSSTRGAALLLAGRAPWLARVVSVVGLVATAVALLAGPVDFPFRAGIAAVAGLAIIDALLDARAGSLVTSEPASRAASAVGALHVTFERWLVPTFRSAAALVEQGGEQVIGAAADALAGAALRTSAAAASFQRASVWGHEALLLAAAVAIVVDWIVR